MSVIADKTSQALGLMKKPAGQQFDPLTILALVSIIIEIVRLVRECKETPESALLLMRRPGGLRLFRLRGIIRDHFPERVTEVELALRFVGTKLTKSDVKKLYKEQEVATEESKQHVAGLVMAKIGEN